MTRRRTAFRPHGLELDDRCLPSGLEPTLPPGLTPAQITSISGLDAIRFPAPDGTPVQGAGPGQTIALIEVAHDPNIQSDLDVFDRRYDLPAPPRFSVINLAGDQTDDGWSQEEALDVEWAHALAPGASLLVVEAAPGWTAMQELQN